MKISTFEKDEQPKTNSLFAMCPVYNMNGGVVRDKQAWVQSEWLFVRYNTDAHIVKFLWYEYM